MALGLVILVPLKKLVLYEITELFDKEIKFGKNSPLSVVEVGSVGTVIPGRLSAPVG